MLVANGWCVWMCFARCNRRCGCGGRESGFKRRERRRWLHKPPTTRSGQIGIDITVHFHVQCIFPLKRWYYAPYDIHRRLEWSQLGRHFNFIVNLLLLFVRRTAPHRRCRNWQNSFCRLLTLTGGSRCGFSIYFILRMRRALAFI